MIIQLPMQIDLPNGNKELITDEENLIDIADRFIGYEYSKIIEDIISTKSAEEQYAEMKYNGDMINYEQQLDNYNSCLTDINDTLEELENYLSDAKRINRNTIDDFVLRSIQEEVPEVKEVINVEL